MSQSVPNNSRGRMLASIVNKVLAEDLVLKLFVNDILPDDDDEAERYTEAAGFGYGPIALAGKQWSIAKGPPVSASTLPVVFTFTGPLGKVYGYHLVQKKSLKLMWAERFLDGPYHIVYAGSKIEVTPRLEMKAF